MVKQVGNCRVAYIGILYVSRVASAESEPPVSTHDNPPPQERPSPIRRTLADELADDEAAGFEAPSLDGAAQRAYIETLERQIEDLTTQVERRTAEAAAATEQANLAAADITRASQRIARESDKRLEEKLRSLLSSFLEVVDDIDRAMAAAKSSPDPEVVLDGVALIRKSFLARLAQHGVTPSPCLGAAFDPVVHEAVTVIRTTNPKDDGRVVEVLREGYMIGDRVLRPAAVAVARRG